MATQNAGNNTAATVTDANQASITTVTNVVAVGALDAGSITSNFGAIDNGSSNITTTGTGALGNITLGTDGTISALTLTEKASIALDPAGGADGDYSGITVAGTGGATIAFGRGVYKLAGDSEWYEWDADAVGTSGTILIGMTVTPTTNGNPVTILLNGIIRADVAFPTLTIGAPVYVGVTAGAIQVAAPTGTDDVIRVAGFALTANEIYFNPSPSHITHT